MNSESAVSKDDTPQDPGLVNARIIAAATQLFARQGYANTSVREIAEAANTTVPMLYYYFNSKEGLYLHILEEGVRSFLNAIPDYNAIPARKAQPGGNAGTAEHRPEDAHDSASTASISAKDALTCALASIVSFCQVNRVTIELIFESWFTCGCPAGAPRVEHVYSVMVQRFAAILELGIKRGEFRQVDVWMAAQHIVGMVTNIIARHLIGDEGFDPQKTAQDIVDLLVRGLEPR